MTIYKSAFALFCCLYCFITSPHLSYISVLQTIVNTDSSKLLYTLYFIFYTYSIMPSKLVQRNFEKETTYHIANYGIENRPIFIRKEDYQVFYKYMCIYLMPLYQVLLINPTLPFRLYNKNLHDITQLLAYCLLPDHFHFLAYQDDSNSITLFMKQLTNAYTQYFNTKYKRRGALFQGRYKAIQITDNERLSQLSRFIHLHPFNSDLVQALNRYPWSSYMEYVSTPAHPLCTTDKILRSFSSRNSYHTYALNQEEYEKEKNTLKPFLIDR